MNQPNEVATSSKPNIPQQEDTRVEEKINRLTVDVSALTANHLSLQKLNENVAALRRV